MIYTKFHLISPGCPWSSLAYLVNAEILKSEICFFYILESLQTLKGSTEGLLHCKRSGTDGLLHYVCLVLVDYCITKCLPNDCKTCSHKSCLYKHLTAVGKDNIVVIVGGSCSNSSQQAMQ